MNAHLKRLRVILMLVGVVLIAAGCGGTAAPTPAGSPVPTAGPTPGGGDVAPTAGPIGGSNPIAARDVVLAYLAQKYGDQAPPAGLPWAEQDTTGQGMMGGSSLEYTSGDWKIAVAYPIVAPMSTIYKIAVANTNTGFNWEGRVDAWGAVSEGPEAVLNARDLALGSIARKFSVQNPPAELSWSGGRVTPAGTVGAETYEYHAGDWTATIVQPVTLPENVVYTIEVTNPTADIRWSGEVDAQGNVTEK